MTSCTCARSGRRTSPRPRSALAPCRGPHTCGSTARSSCERRTRFRVGNSATGGCIGAGALVEHVRHRLELILLRRLHDCCARCVSAAAKRGTSKSGLSSARDDKKGVQPAHIGTPNVGVRPRRSWWRERGVAVAGRASDEAELTQTSAVPRSFGGVLVRWARCAPVMIHSQTDRAQRTQAMRKGGASVRCTRVRCRATRRGSLPLCERWCSTGQLRCPFFRDLRPT